MIKNTIISILLIFSLSVISAQQIYFCQSHTENGEPVGAANVWKIKNNGGYLYILFDNEETLLPEGLYYMLVDKEIDGEFVEYESKTVKLESEKDWLAYNYIFKEPGRYNFSFISPNQQKLGTSSVRIRMEGDKQDIENIIKRFKSDQVKTFFCEWVIDDKPMKRKTQTSLQKNAGMIFCYLETMDPLNTEKLYVEVWKKEFSSTDYDKFVTSKKYKVTPTWYFTYFRYQFITPGEYRFDIFDSKQRLFSSAYITVTE